MQHAAHAPSFCVFCIFERVLVHGNDSCAQNCFVSHCSFTLSLDFLDVSRDRLQSDAVDATDDEKLLERQIEQTVQAQWDRHRRWAIVSNRRRIQIHRARVAKLFLLVTGALVQQLPDSFPLCGKYRGWIGGLCVAAVPYLKNRMLQDEDVARMIKSSWTSQAIEAEVFKFRARAAEYSYFKTNPLVALHALRRRCYELTLAGREADDLFDRTMPDDKPVPGWLNTAEEYIRERLDHQINEWYKKRAKQFDRRYDLCIICETPLLVGAAISSFGKTLVPALDGWCGFFTTAATAIGAHLAAQNYHEISQQYHTAAIKLEYIKETWPPVYAACSGSRAWEDNVKRTEAVIRSTVDEWAKAKSGDGGFVPPKVKGDEEGPKKWDPDVVCGTDDTGFYLAVDRARWLVENKSMKEEEAQNKVMEEYPENFH